MGQLDDLLTQLQATAATIATEITAATAEFQLLLQRIQTEPVTQAMIDKAAATLAAMNASATALAVLGQDPAPTPASHG